MDSGTILYINGPTVLDQGENAGINENSISVSQLEVLPMEDILVKQYPVWKRLMDIFGAITALVLFAPLILMIGIYIKIVSPGPIFFKQERIGYGEKPFTFWKFRTMHHKCETKQHENYLKNLIKSCDNGSDSKPMEKLDEEDPNLIPHAKILRSSCLDELPQLINVLKGEMSLVGPRPPIRYEYESYYQWYKNRFNVLPGMTGLWQVSGKNKLTFNEMIRLDVNYSEDQSLILDLYIIFKTPFEIIKMILNK